MKTTVSKSDFRDAFRAMGRTDQFSYEGLGALYDGLLEYEDATGSEIELDVIALCCEFYEATWQDIADDYRIDLSECEDEDEIEDTVKDYLNDHSYIMGFVTGGCIYQAF